MPLHKYLTIIYFSNVLSCFCRVFAEFLLSYCRRYIFGRLNKNNLRSAITMKLSWSFVISGVFIGYICYSMYTFAQLFRSLQCTSETDCFQSFLNKNPKLQLALFTSTSLSPISTEVKKLTNIRNFDYREPYTRFDLFYFT